MYFPGCSLPSPAYGFDNEDMTDMLSILGSNNKVRLLTLSELNPAVEKSRSSKLLAKNVLASFLTNIKYR